MQVDGGLIVALSVIMEWPTINRGAFLSFYVLAAGRAWGTVEPLIKDPMRKGHCMLDLSTLKGHCFEPQKNTIPYTFHTLETSKERTVTKEKTVQLLNLYCPLSRKTKCCKKNPLNCSFDCRTSYNIVGYQRRLDTINVLLLIVNF